MEDKVKISILKRKIEILEKMIEDNSRTIFHTNEVLQQQQAQIMFNAKLASVGEMASSIAHEINNPIGIIDGQIRQLNFYIAENHKLKAQETLSKVQKNILRVIKIVRGLRQLSKSSETESLEVFNLNLFLLDFKDFNYVKTIDSSVQIIYPEFTEDFLVKAKETSLSQILTNLINNSLDAISLQNSPWINLHLSRNNERIMLRVCDSGKGIDESHVKLLFDPFFTTKNYSKGSGVGLNVSKKLSKDMGGDLRYELYEGNTSFVLELNAA